MKTKWKLIIIKIETRFIVTDLGTLDVRVESFLKDFILKYLRLLTQKFCMSYTEL